MQLRRASASALCAAVIAVPACEGSPREPATTPAGEQAVETGARDRAAAFAARAVASRGFAGPHLHYDYAGTETLGPSSWEATFDSPRGEVRLVLGEKPRGPAIVAVEGAATERERASLLAYREHSEPHLGWSFAAVELEPRSGRITGTMVWEGPVGVSGIGSKCTARVLDDQGRELWAKEGSFDLKGPAEETDRSNAGGASFGTPPRRLVGDIPDVACETWRGEGWQPAGEPDLDVPVEGRPVTGEPVVAVTTRLRWRGPSFMGYRTRCTATLQDDDGRPLGEGTATFVPPFPRQGSDRPAFRRERLSIFVPADDPDAAESAVVACDLLGPEDF